MNRYRLFGETIAVDRELALPRREESGGEPDVRVEEHAELEAAVDGDRLGHLAAGRVDLQYGGWLAALRPGERYIWYQRRLLGDFDLPFLHVFERLVSPLYATLSHSEYICLHGGAVIADGRAWLVTGDTGAGKSTTSYELMHRYGARLSSDEMAVIDVERGNLLAGSRAVRLARPAGSLEEAVEESEVHPELEKRWFRLAPEHLAEGSAPLAGIIYLDPRDAGAREGESRDGVAFEALSGSEKLTRLLEQCFDFEEGTDRWRRRRFRNAARLAGDTPVYRCSFQRSPDGEPAHVPAVWDFITSDERAGDR